MVRCDGCSNGLRGIFFIFDVAEAPETFRWCCHDCQLVICTLARGVHASSSAELMGAWRLVTDTQAGTCRPVSRAVRCKAGTEQPSCWLLHGERTNVSSKLWIGMQLYRSVMSAWWVAQKRLSCHIEVCCRCWCWRLVLPMCCLRAPRATLVLVVVNTG